MTTTTIYLIIFTLYFAGLLGLIVWDPANLKRNHNHH